MNRSISDFVREEYPDIVSKAGHFPCEVTFEIGFINPNVDNHHDGIANDETILAAESIEDLEALYSDFCEENDIPKDTVTYAYVSAYDSFGNDVFRNYGMY